MLESETLCMNNLRTSDRFIYFFWFSLFDFEDEDESSLTNQFHLK